MRCQLVLVSTNPLLFGKGDQCLPLPYEIVSDGLSLFLLQAVSSAPEKKTKKGLVSNWINWFNWHVDSIAPTYDYAFDVTEP